MSEKQNAAPAGRAGGHGDKSEEGDGEEHI